MNRLSMYPPRLDGENIERKRKEILEYFYNTYDLYEKIFDILKDDSVFYKKSEPTRHPMIFYFGHTATFFVNKLINMQIIKKRVDPELESIFAVGVDEMDWDDLDSINYNWPSVDEVRVYRKKVKELVGELILNIKFTLPINKDQDMWIVLMGIEHERIHIETSSVLHRQMPLKFIKSSSDFIEYKNSNNFPKNDMIIIPTCDVSLGKNDVNVDIYYGWDNEYGLFNEHVDEFKTSKYLVSNGEFMEFVEVNGYDKEEYWSEEGIKFLKKTKAKHPLFWVKDNGTFRYRSLDKLIEMPYDWPVDVNALEAEAFCRFKSLHDGIQYSLPSESEYAAILKYVGVRGIVDDTKANHNLKYSSSSPVNKYPFKGKNSEVIYDVVGNVWQWSRTPIFGFNGFKVHPAYDDFSTPTFDKKHALILGSSWASSGNLIMKGSRYAFRRHFYQHAGFRYVIENSTKNINENDVYESDALVSQYCEFQYGDTHFGVKNFAQESAKIASSFCKNKTKALDLGCATGRTTFELAREFDEVNGIDFSVRFIGVGSKLKTDGYVSFSVKEEGELSIDKKYTLVDLGYEKLKNKVNFWQGDACNLKPNFNSYDLVMATNLIDRLYDPKLFLKNIHKKINKDGVLVITSPYTWQEQSTKKEDWLGGYKNVYGQEIRTMDNLKIILGDNFELMHTQDLEFVIKETARKFQHSISEVSVWKKI